MGRGWERRSTGSEDGSRGTRRFVLATLNALLVGLAVARAETPLSSTVGMPRQFELVLPGPELVAKPIASRRTPVVVRIAEVYPHGSAFRYELIYYGLDPGKYDLRDYLVRKDGTPAEGLPAIPVSVESLLPPGQIEPGASGLGTFAVAGRISVAPGSRGIGLGRGGRGDLNRGAAPKSGRGGRGRRPLSPSPIACAPSSKPDSPARSTRVSTPSSNAS